MGYFLFLAVTPLSLAQGEAVKKVVLEDNGLTSEIATTAGTVADFLSQNNLAVQAEDLLYPGQDQPLFTGRRIIIRRATPVTIKADGQEQKVFTFRRQVREVLAENRITVGPADRLEPGADQGVLTDIVIVVIRVATEEKASEETIDFTTEKYDDASLYIGEKKTTRAGQDGLVAKTWRLTFENGREVNRVLIKSEEKRPTINARVAYGTKQRIGRTLTGQASWWGAAGLTCAARDFGRGKKLRVTNASNGRLVEVTVSGYGPLVSTGRLVDLSREAFSRIADPGVGVVRVKIEELL